MTIKYMDRDLRIYIDRFPLLAIGNRFLKDNG